MSLVESSHSGHSHAPREPELLRSREVARRLNLSTRRVQMLLKAGMLPGVRIGRTWLIPGKALDDYLRAVQIRARNNLVQREQSGEI